MADLVSSLAAPATWARIKGVMPSHPKTFQWLYDHQVVTFSDWLQSPGRDYEPIYWIQGLPGSGKSTLMKFSMLDKRTADLLDSQDRTTPSYVLAGFFFHDRGSAIQKSISGMFQGLLYSILHQVLKLRAFVQPIYAQLVDTQQSKTPKWDQESLELAFEAILQQREVTTRLCLFLDAFDEHHGDNEELVSLMSRLVSHTDRDRVKIKICIASRPWDTFVNNFSKCPGFKIHEHTFNDILEYASSTIHKASPVDLREESSPNARLAKLDALADQIAKMAYGVFIWVRIVVEEIANGVRSRTPLFVLEETLAHMPKELKDLYEHTLERIETGHAEEVFVMLQIAICALSPLPLVTFLNATSFILWAKYSALGEESEDDMICRVVSRSGGLLEVVTSSMATSVRSAPPIPESSVQFIHQTVKEYIHERKDNFGLRRSKTGGNGFEYLFNLAAVCWEDWAKGIGIDLFEYATLARLADTPKEILTGAFLCLFDMRWETNSDNIIEKVTTRLDWWLEQKDSEPQIRFYTYELFPPINTPRCKLICLAFVAGFDVSFLFDMLFSMDRDGIAFISQDMVQLLRDILFCIATIGPKIINIPTSRKDMLSSLMTPFPTTSARFSCFIPKRIPTGTGLLEEVEPDALLLLIFAKGIYDQDESERVSAIRFLLEHGSDPNIPISRIVIGAAPIPGTFQTQWGLTSTNNFRTTLFEQVIKQESAQVVRLFGDHGAKVPNNLLVPILTFWWKLPKPSDVLQEVLRIVSRDHPTSAEVQIDYTAGAVVLCGIIGMSVGGGIPMVRRVLPERGVLLTR